MVDVITYEEAGSFFMGFFVSWIAFYFFNRDDKFSGTEFAAFMTAIFGGAVVTVFSTYLTADDKWVFWIYPLGLVVGMFCFYLMAKHAKGNITMRYGKEHEPKPPVAPK
jgi:membrane protein DedA with SNARE-associated domain